jgi:uncharacterized protein (TIGR03083 family)
MMTITRANATGIAEVEDGRFLALLRDLTDAEWATPTCCDGWDVRAMSLHVLGAAESASKRELVHQFRLGSKVAKELGRVPIDGVNEVQIRERQHLTNAELVDRLAAAQPRFRRSRRSLPAPIRAVAIPAPPHGKVKLGTLMDRTYTRDVWMHRVDICRATGRDIELTPDHDGVIVTDVVEEWAAQHGQPCTLVLTGPAGGRWTFGGGDGEHIELDAVDFCETMAGRREGDGLLSMGVLF